MTVEGKDPLNERMKQMIGQSQPLPVGVQWILPEKTVEIVALVSACFVLAGGEMFALEEILRRRPTDDDHHLIGRLKFEKETLPIGQLSGQCVAFAVVDEMNARWDHFDAVELFAYLPREHVDAELHVLRAIENEKNATGLEQLTRLIRVHIWKRNKRRIDNGFERSERTRSMVSRRSDRVLHYGT